MSYKKPRAVRHSGSVVVVAPSHPSSPTATHKKKASAAGRSPWRRMAEGNRGSVVVVSPGGHARHGGQVVAGLGAFGLGAVKIGTLASRDIVMSSASLLASQILREASKERSSGGQLRVIRSKANQIQSGLAQKFDDNYRMLAVRGARGTQVTFNALRLAIANVLADDAVDKIKAMVAATTGNAEALGQAATGTDYTGSDVACGVMTGTSLLSTLIGGLTHTSVTDSSTAIQGAANNFCGARTQANTAAQIDAQNQQTQANLAIAQQNAATAQAAMAAEQSKQGTMVKLAMIGGGVLLVGLIGVAVVKKI